MKKFGIRSRSWTLNLLAQTLTVASLIFFAGNAIASTITSFNGLDNAAPVTGPFPNSATAQLSLLTAASAYGTINTITFEGLPTGFTNSPVTVAPGVTETQAGPNFGGFPSLVGISSASFSPGNNGAGFNTTPGGSYFLSLVGNPTTFNFAAPTNSFGFYGKGLNSFASDAIILTFNDGTPQTVNFFDVTASGGAEYFGLTDTAAFTSITITDLPLSPPTTDIWGIDDVSYDSPSSATTAITPEPSSLLLLGTGALATVAAIRRKR